MSAVAKRAMATTFVGLFGALFVVSVAAQSVDIPSNWIDVSDRAPAFDELVAVSRGAATTESFWLGYSFPLREGVHVGCGERNGRSVSFDSDGMRLYFADEGRDRESNVCDESHGVFLRFEGNVSEVAEARLLTLRQAASRINTDVVWAGDYAANQSSAFLRSAVLGGDGPGASTIVPSSDVVRERLLSAVAVHDDDAAIDVVFESLNPEQPESLREAAVYWAAQVGGDDGLARLLQVGRGDEAAEVRKQAIFWLGQVAGERSTAHLATIAQDDPDNEVRTSAVFALSQSEDPAAVDALIRIVRTHENRDVVKAALFWLGQSGDARVIELLEEILFGGRD
jgi:HEAT repeat protein